MASDEQTKKKKTLDVEWSELRAALERNDGCGCGKCAAEILAAMGEDAARAIRADPHQDAVQDDGTEMQCSIQYVLQIAGFMAGYVGFPVPYAIETFKTGLRNGLTASEPMAGDIGALINAMVDAIKAKDEAGDSDSAKG